MKHLPANLLSFLCLQCLFWLAAFGISGCGSGVGTVSGQLLLEGKPISGEVLFEPLDEEHKLAGQSKTAFADTSGRFSVLLSETGDAKQIRIVIRATPHSDDGVPSAFDSRQLPEKVATLARELPLRKSLVFALTR